ncbi:MAG: hypothetical protein LT102_04260 [Burkholderiaceae bacterium]|nr:hypothetical protein [Burkholderiaceae bacterium]
MLTETCHILLRRGGSATQRRFVESWVKGSFDVHDLNAAHAAHFRTYRWKQRSPFRNLLLPD